MKANRKAIYGVLAIVIAATVVVATVWVVDRQQQSEKLDPDMEAVEELKAALREAEKDPEFVRRTEQSRREAAENMKNIGRALLEYEEKQKAAGGNR